MQHIILRYLCLVFLDFYTKVSVMSSRKKTQWSLKIIKCLMIPLQFVSLVCCSREINVRIWNITDVDRLLESLLSCFTNFFIKIK